MLLSIMKAPAMVFVYLITISSDCKIKIFFLQEPSIGVVIRYRRNWTN